MYNAREAEDVDAETIFGFASNAFVQLCRVHEAQPETINKEEDTPVTQLAANVCMRQRAMFVRDVYL
jgi:hypothetical protein